MSKIDVVPMAILPNAYRGGAVERAWYLQVVQAGLAADQPRFAREAVLHWLACYPGDLGAGFLYARALLSEGRPAQALPVLAGLLRADPAALDVLEVFDLAAGSATLPAHLRQPVYDPAARSAARLVLSGRSPAADSPAGWGNALRAAWLELEKGDLQTASSLLPEILALGIEHPLVGLVHLQCLSGSLGGEPAGAAAPLVERLAIVEGYLRSWPDCLGFMLWQADWLMENSESTRAVALLHQAAARDVEGRVARRLWGDSHPYRSLWPDRLERALDLPVPAEVGAVLGWNRLTAGADAPPAPAQEENREAEPLPPPAPPVPDGQLEPEIPAPESDRMDAAQPVDSESLDTPVHPLEWALYPVQDEPARAEAAGPEASSGAGSSGKRAPGVSAAARVAVAKTLPRPEAQAVSDALDRLAFGLGREDLPGQDGRYPVYVVFSTRSRLQSVYGPKAADLVEAEMEALCKAVKAEAGWDALLYLADTPVCTLPLGLTPARPEDAWELKLALADLDAALGQRGERIGALLIVGGPEIVPFHHLPNPVDDQDLDVPSDNPYALRGDNYFVPEWPVGRLPGGAGGDARLLLDGLRRFRKAHQSRRQTVFQQWWGRFAAWLTGLKSGGSRPSVGYTAAIWRRASADVFYPIGWPAAMHISPPSGALGPGVEGAAASAGVSGVPALAGRLGYFNLHGLVDAPEWYGHRDPAQAFDGPDYPVALRPEDIQARAQNGTLPQVVFSEACYGLHIQDRPVDQAISLKLLEAGSLAVAGSTCMAYGSIDSPLVAADLLGHTFLSNVKQGLPAGEALRQAKLTLASMMHRRQGYLDGEDQKTMISFTLYGDPLARPKNRGELPKSVRYSSKPLERVKTVCDRAASTSSLPPAKVMASVENIISRYLPGMGDARVLYACEREECNGTDHSCPTSQLKDQLGEPAGPAVPVAEPAANLSAKAGPGDAPCQPVRRSLVTLSKQFQHTDGVHTEVARLTLDENGKLVKLVVSR